LTRELKDWLDEHRYGATTHVREFPFSRWTLQRMRRLLGHHGKLDRRQWWIDRIDDLATLLSKDFVAKYASERAVSDAAVDLARKELLGLRGQHKAEWRTHADLILGPLPTQAVATQLGYSVDVICKMRYRLEEEQGLPHRRERGVYSRPTALEQASEPA
jgi:hypothetical protein